MSSYICTYNVNGDGPKKGRVLYIGGNRCIATDAKGEKKEVFCIRGGVDTDNPLIGLAHQRNFTLSDDALGSQFTARWFGCEKTERPADYTGVCKSRVGCLESGGNPNCWDLTVGPRCKNHRNKYDCNQERNAGNGRACTWEVNENGICKRRSGCKFFGPANCFDGKSNCNHSTKSGCDRARNFGNASSCYWEKIPEIRHDDRPDPCKNNTTYPYVKKDNAGKFFCYQKPGSDLSGLACNIDKDKYGKYYGTEIGVSKIVLPCEVKNPCEDNKSFRFLNRDNHGKYYCYKEPNSLTADACNIDPNLFPFDQDILGEKAKVGCQEA